MVDVTIAIISHNHVYTVEKAIQSVISQKLSYSFVLFLFDDASTDGTEKILRKYYKEYPNVIKLFLFDKCCGPIVRARQIYQNSNSKYLCWLDADDYWTYDKKLQTQIDFLEKNPDYVGCFHDAEIISSVDNNNEKVQKQSLQKYKYYSQFNHYETQFYPYQLLMRNIIPTASLVFRSLNFDYFFNNYKFLPYSFSWAYQLYIIRNSKFYYFNEVWSVYYDHADGISKKISSELFTLNNIHLLKWYKKDSFYKNYKNKIYLTIAKEYEILSHNNKEKYLKYGFFMQYYLFKAWYVTAKWYFLNIIKHRINS